MESYEIIQNIIQVDLHVQSANDGKVQNKAATATARQTADEFFKNFDGTPDEICDTLTAGFKVLDEQGHFGIKGTKVSANSRVDKVTARMQSAARTYSRSFEAHYPQSGLTIAGYNPFKVKEVAPKAKKSPIEKLMDACQDCGLDQTGLRVIRQETDRQLARMERENERMKEDAAAAAVEQKEKDVANAEKAAQAAIKALQKLGKSADEIAKLTGKAATN